MPLPEARTRIENPGKQSYFLEYVNKLNLNVPIILVGGHRNIERLEEIINQGTIDFIALSRPLISEPDLPNRWLKGWGSENTDCVSCNFCIFAMRISTVCVRKQPELREMITKVLGSRPLKDIFR
jgi:2,4-dienoyl-CoA reductase-like NADH-dependent reductase (Old Yellow Enzyme family)